MEDDEMHDAMLRQAIALSLQEGLPQNGVQQRDAARRGSNSLQSTDRRNGHTVAESILQAAIALSQQDHDVVQHNADRRGSSLPSEEEMDNYRILGEIVTGGQGSLFKGQTRNGAKEFVMKKLKCETTAEKEKVEVWALQFMTAVSHPNIIRYLKVEVPSPKEVIICMPMYKEGDLEKYIAEATSAIAERTIASFVKQIASALKYLHTFTLAGRPRPMLHRDIKPGNVLLSQNKTKCVLIDFDSWGRTGVAAKQGALEYMAPEAIAGKECEPAVDIFSLGIILYVLLALPSYPMLECNGDSFVLGAADWEQHPDKLRSALKSSIRQCGDYGDDIQELCLKMLAFNPAHRPTAEYVETTLEILEGRLKALEGVDEDEVAQQHTGLTVEETTREEAERVRKIARALPLPRGHSLVRQLTDVAEAVAGGGDAALCLAAERGWADCLESLLVCGFDVRVVSKRGLGALHTAAACGHLDCVKFLLDNGAEVDVSAPDKSTALHAAASGGYQEIVEILLRAGADANGKGNDQTPLYAAASAGYKEVVEMLLHAGADPDAGNDWTPLHAAAHHGHESTVELLLEQGADVHAVGGFKRRTALHAAASSSSPKPCVLQCLLAHSANPNELDADGSTALDLAAAEQQATRDVLRPVTRVCVLAQVAEGSEEWNTVCQRVQETMPQARVTCLELVRNRALLEKHELEKRHMWCRNGKESRLLFHGTKNTPPKDIYNGIDGFDMRFSKQGMWGKALYFAQNSRYSDDYRHTKPDGQFQMFLAEVCIGDYKQLQPDSTLTHPPPTDHDFGANAPERLRYNSVKGHTNGSDVFMVYSNSQAYPKYLITYRHGL